MSKVMTQDNVCFYAFESTFRILFAANLIVFLLTLFWKKKKYIKKIFLNRKLFEINSLRKK